MSKFYIVGASAKPRANRLNPESLWRSACIGLVDPESGRFDLKVEYAPPPETHHDQNPSLVFKAATVERGRLYACTETEVLIFQLPQFRRVGYISLPCFNDLHHVLPLPDGSLMIACTGLDMVVQVSPEGQVLQEWNVCSEATWQRFSRDVDYRKVPSTKPHLAHPNYVFQLGGEFWVTRFQQRDAICLSEPSRRINIEVEKPHDGRLFNGRIYFTTVDGHVVIADAARCEVEQIINLREIAHKDRLLGWCRGIEVLDEDRVVVAFTALRQTKFAENVRWVQYQMGLRDTVGCLPARIALYDLRRRKLCWEFDLASHGFDAVFSIHSVDYPPDADTEVRCS